jgi:Uma2 family endonuclease
MSTGIDFWGALPYRVAIPPVPVSRLTVDHYVAMFRAGIVTEDDRIELLDGWLVPKATKTPPHCAAAGLVGNWLCKTAPAGWCGFMSASLRLATSMPDPDVVVLRGEIRSYGERWPEGKDIGLVVEVAGESVFCDQSLKKSIYAQAGIPCYWLVNLVERRIEEYTEPVAGENADYRQRRNYSGDDEIALVLVGQQIANVPVGDLLP